MSYVKSEVAESSWEAISESSNTGSTYNNFKGWLLELYNQTVLQYILLDPDHLIGERQRLRICSLRLQDLSLDFHFRFNVISSFLMTNQLLSSREQLQAYLRVSDELLQNRIMMWLQIKLPNHPSLLYTINEAYNAAKWVLQGTSSPMGLSLTASSPTLTPTTIMAKSTPNQGYIKTEQLGSFLSEFTKMIVNMLNTNRACSSMSGYGPSTPWNNKCLFDGCDTFLHDCAGVKEYVKQGKCWQNHKGKVILSSGAFIPWEISGKFLKDCIDKWHCRNLNQLAKGVLSHNTSLLWALVPTQSTLMPIGSVPYTAAYYWIMHYVAWSQNICSMSYPERFRSDN